MLRIASLVVFLPVWLHARQRPPEQARWLDHPEVDAQAYHVSLSFDLSAKRARGFVEYTFKALKDIQRVRLDLVASKDWKASFETMKGAPLTAKRKGDELHVRLPEPVGAGATIRFRARLEGRPPDGLYFAKTRYKEACVFTDHFPARARGWLPSEDHPADRALFSIELELPENFGAIGTGVGGYERAADGRRVWRSRCQQELPVHLFAFSVAPYVEIEEPGDERLFPHRVYRKDRSTARKTLGNHAAWIAIMEKHFGPYPYGKYCVAQVPTRWGGMENAGNTWIMESLLDSHRGGSGTLAHELVHQWFGDSVGYQDWVDIWLSEGFASYFGPWLDEQIGGPDMEGTMEGLRDRWLRSREGKTLPVRHEQYRRPIEVLNSNAYPKGAWILHMLRLEIGDEAFFGGLRDYYQAHTHAGVRTADLVAKIEAAAKQELDWFFEQWLDRPDCPNLKFEWSEATVKVFQAQAGAPYRFPLTIQWTGADGDKQEKTLQITARESEWPLGPGPIRAPIIDPHVQLLFRRVW